MLTDLRRRISDYERRLRTSFGDDISTPEARKRARRHYLWMDHGILRGMWHNFHKVAEGAYRSNQPSPARLRQFRDMGIRTIINLRGPSAFSPYLFEREACEELGLTLIDAHVNGGSPSMRSQYLYLLDAFDRAERPFVMHCKSGADRAGLASVLYLLHVERRPLAEARRQLHWRYLHLRNTHHGILDTLIDLYDAGSDGGAKPIRDWFAEDYDPEALAAAHRAPRRRAPA